jgi:fumarate hydratase class I
MTRTIEHPFTLEKIGALKAGDAVRVSGRILTARDRVHKWLAEGGRVSADLRDGAVFHCGPVVVRRDGVWRVRASGPTTSMRQDPYLPAVLRKYHVRVVIGKGGVGEATRRACAECGCVYLHAVGGAGALLAGTVESVAGVQFLREFGPSEAMWELVVRDLPAVVTVDAQGKSIHRRVEAASRRALRRLLDEPAGRGTTAATTA